MNFTYFEAGNHSICTMKKNTVFFIFLLSFGLLLKGQNTYIPGYYIDKSGDTIRGEIKYNPDKETELYKKLYFRTDDKSPPKQFQATQIREFSCDDKVFESVKFSGQPRFMKILCKGRVMLYEHLNTTTNEFHEAGETSYVMIKDHEDKIVEVFLDNHMKKELKEYLHEDEKSLEEIQHMGKVNLEHVKQVIKSYNQRHPDLPPKEKTE